MKKILFLVSTFAFLSFGVHAQTPEITPQGSQSGTVVPGTGTVQPNGRVQPGTNPPGTTVPATIQPGINDSRTTTPGVPDGMNNTVNPHNPVTTSPSRMQGTNPPTANPPLHSGTIKTSRTMLKENELPPEILNTLKGKDFNGWQYSSGYRISDKDVYYEIKLMNKGNSKVIKLDKDGNAYPEN